ncbi:MAG: 50S ribosomal protein L20 [Rickettsiales bacterium]|nr:50S ribosomal protein L20 [Rickettsiales bacterium]|tara:strand:- start:132 stop:485 length:354 start_codon:yes stop_codon:yes gene_type:complete
MSRVKSGVTTRARHKKILKQAKGYYGRRKNTFRIANQAVEKAGQYSYRDRKVNKRVFRSLWIQRINAGCRLHGLKYSTFVNGLKKIKLNLNRKVLADLAAQEPKSFEKIVSQIQNIK